MIMRTKIKIIIIIIIILIIIIIMIVRINSTCQDQARPEARKTLTLNPKP